jgi:ABC-2 type transport system ATP-binding protein
MIAESSVPLVVLHQALSLADRRSNVPPLELALGAGVHAILGRPEDGTQAIAPLVGGLAGSIRGQVIVAGRNPIRDPSLRAHIGVTLETPCLPRAGRVADYLEQVRKVRGDGSSLEQPLEAFGLSHWLGRRMSQLSRAEARTLELLVAATTPEPFAIALTEPGADIAPFERQALRAALLRAVQGGACVMIMTASMVDAVELATTIQLLERGQIARWVPVDESAALVPGRGTALQIEVDIPRLLVAALADDPAVSGLDWSPDGHRSMISIRGEDLDQLALAVARAAQSAGVKVRSITPAAPGLEEIRAAASGLALAAYHAAYRAYYAQQAEPTSPSTPPPSREPPP